jgi:hypothetical protein
VWTPDADVLPRLPEPEGQCRLRLPYLHLSLLSMRIAQSVPEYIPR